MIPGKSDRPIALPNADWYIQRSEVKIMVENSNDNDAVL